MFTKTVIPVTHGRHGKRVVIIENDDTTTVKAVCGCQRKRNYRVLYTESLLYPYPETTLNRVIDQAIGVLK